MWTTTGERQQVSPSRTMVVFTDDYEHALMTWRTRTRRRRRLTAADSSPAVAGGRLTAGGSAGLSSSGQDDIRVGCQPQQYYERTLGRAPRQRRQR